MIETETRDATRTVLESARSGQGAKFLKEWKEKSPESQVLTARKMLHTSVTPSLIEAGLPADEVQEVEAIFESIFQSYEHAGQRTRTPSSSG